MARSASSFASLSLSGLMESFIVKRFGDESAWRTTFGGDLERFNGDIRWRCLIGSDRKAGAVAGGGIDAVDCVAFDVKGGRYARINRDRCALDWWASEKKEKKKEEKKLSHE